LAHRCVHSLLGRCIDRRILEVRLYGLNEKSNLFNNLCITRLSSELIGAVLIVAALRTRVPQWMTAGRSLERYRHDGLIRVSSRNMHPSKIDETACFDFLMDVLSAHQIRKEKLLRGCSF
jgi:hypothetical protein